MKVTQREDFGLIIMSILARHFADGFISVTTIARETGLSPLFLKHIVATLLKNGLIKSREGLKGGYRLVDPPDTVNVAQIVSAMSGEVMMPYCNYGDCRIKGKKCVLPVFWGKINKKILSYLQEISLSNFARV